MQRFFQLELDFSWIAVPLRTSVQRFARSKSIRVSLGYVCDPMLDVLEGNWDPALLGQQTKTIGAVLQERYVFCLTDF